MFDHPSASKLDEDSGANTSESRHKENLRLSSLGDGPIDEYEEWKKIENFMNILGEEIGEERKEVEHTTSDVGKWLSGFDLGLYESYLLANGFDDIEFLAGGILEEQDLLQMGVLDPVYRRKILDNVAQLPLPPRVGVNNFKPSTVEEWLNALRLEEYLDLFHQKGYDSIDRIKQMWELELESILAIHTLGHRKRILASLPEVKRRDTLIVSAEDIKDRLAEIDVFGGERRETLDMVNPGIYQWKSSGFHQHSSTTDGRNATEIVQFKEEQSHNDLSQNGKTSRDGERKHRQQQQEIPQPKFMHKQQNQQKEHAQLPSQVQAPPQKSEQQQQDPTKVNIQRNGSRSPQWNHPPEALLRGSVNYTTKYLGSHFIKDIIGESSTIEACRKMRMSTQKLQKIPAVILSISVTGVRFIDAKSRIVISSHYIHNISYCTQDLEDRSVLAYIAKDQKANAHYCHVFKVHNSAVSDEIVMTLGQAFELAYEQYTHAQYTSGNK